MPTDVEDQDAVTSIAYMVLLVARLGEVDRRSWWGTRSFGAAGRVVLKQRLPRTWRMAAVELDIAAARHRHDEVISRRSAVHLFSDNWPARRWASAWVAEQKTVNPPDPFFEALEVMDDEAIVGLLRPTGTTSASDGAVCLGSIKRTDLDRPSSIHLGVVTLASAYAEMASFGVPYLEVVE